MLSRRQFCKMGIATAASAAVMSSGPVTRPAAAEEAIHIPFVRRYERPARRPNVLFISIDDLNDWIGPLGGHPDVKSPHINALAQRSMLFSRAYCAYPLCNPSRAALMTGVAASTSGIYTNLAYFRTSPALSDAKTIPQYFMEHGYRATGAGKTYCSFVDPPSWQEYWPGQTVQFPQPLRPPRDEFPLSGLPEADYFFDWGPLQAKKEETSDWRVAAHVGEMLRERYDEPFFISCGFTSPHLPFYAPQEYFDRHASVSLPATVENDLDDVPRIARQMALRSDTHEAVLRGGPEVWTQAVRSYLACISLTDDCVGQVLGELDNSRYRDNTVVVLWSDHGLHLGEKEHWKKGALWEDTTRNILMFSGPGVGHAGSRINTPVSLLDIYPTLVELCGLESKSGLQGRSLVPFFSNPDHTRSHPAITCVRSSEGVHFSVRSGPWRYTQYADDTMELYDHREDPNEWTNLAGRPAYAPIVSELAQWIPEDPARPVKPVS